MENRELTLEENIKQLLDLRNNFYENGKESLFLIDELLDRIENVDEKQTNNVVLLGSYVDLELDGEFESYYIGLECDSENTISVLSPLAFAIFGKSIGSTASYCVEKVPINVRIVAKNNFMTEDKTYNKSLVNN